MKVRILYFVTLLPSSIQAATWAPRSQLKDIIFSVLSLLPSDCGRGTSRVQSSTAKAPSMLHTSTSALSQSPCLNLVLLFFPAQTPALLPLAAYPFLAVGDCYCIYRELKAVQLRTLNRERAELVAEQWVKMGKVPHTEEFLIRASLTSDMGKGGLGAVHRGCVYVSNNPMQCLGFVGKGQIVAVWMIMPEMS
eukprot:scaffold156782_cov19-Tisochrysis_lutea.AAC.1